MRKRRRFSSSFKFKVALDALTERLTISELCKEHQVHASQIHQWKRQLKAEGSLVFQETKKADKGRPSDSDLHAKIGELLMERDFLKKVLAD